MEDSQLLSDRPLRDDYQKAMIASGLVDDVTDISRLASHPYRYAEGEVICSQGDSPDCLWVIVSGSVAVREEGRTQFVRRRSEVVGEQTILGNGYRRIYELVANESNVEVLIVDKSNIEQHPESRILFRNIARIISIKLRGASAKISTLSRQLEDDTRILHAYTNQYALSRRMQSGGGKQTAYRVDRAIIWFSDVVDFSQHTIGLTPERTADIVQRFFNAQSDPIVSHGGHIDKFIGDGLMAFWVLPDHDEPGGHCLEVVRAAEEAVSAVSEIRVGQSPLRLRIGLHIGLVLSGDFGSITRHQFTLIGTEVNKAARLEEVRAEDVIDGTADLRDIRMSAEFRIELSETVQQRYRRRSVARAKNIGEIEIYS